MFEAGYPIAAIINIEGKRVEMKYSADDKNLTQMHRDLSLTFFGLFGSTFTLSAACFTSFPEGHMVGFLGTRSTMTLRSAPQNLIGKSV